ncbi:hypothetical protein [Bergeyella porcorum]|uniref:hypothetical protein n=1 Tax=Bergeyella porcorum TaxID=1735111 RepID=UPI00399CE69E
MGTRNSPLALWQAEEVAQQLQQQGPHYRDCSHRIFGGQAAESSALCYGDYGAFHKRFGYCIAQ